MIHPYDHPEIRDYSALLVSSFKKLTGRDLIEAENELAKRLFDAPFALVSHGAQEDPIFRYGNRKALELFKMSWDEFSAMPSRLSAEPMLQGERERLLTEALAKGYIDTYEGVRIAKDGQRFMIRDTVLWSVVDERNVRHGQACVIRKWNLLPPAPI